MPPVPTYALISGFFGTDLSSICGIICQKKISKMPKKSCLHPAPASIIPFMFGVHNTVFWHRNLNDIKRDKREYLPSYMLDHDMYLLFTVTFNGVLWFCLYWLQRSLCDQQWSSTNYMYIILLTWHCHIFQDSKETRSTGKKTTPTAPEGTAVDK